MRVLKIDQKLQTLSVHLSNDTKYYTHSFILPFLPKILSDVINVCNYESPEGSPPLPPQTHTQKKLCQIPAARSHEVSKVTCLLYSMLLVSNGECK